jgi:ABC-type sugar transport system substrate-binding protein
MTDQPESTYTIGFSNLTENSQFAVAVREGLEAALAAYPNLTLVCRDNRLDDEAAMANAEEFASIPVDLAIIYHINERLGDKIRTTLTRERKTPIIAVDIPITWATYFGVDNAQSGSLAGELLGQWIQTHWHGEVDKILALTDSRVLELVRQRVDNTLSGMQSLINVDSNNVFHLDCGNEFDTTVERVTPVLERWAEFHRIAAIGFNEESALGVMEAVRAAGRESDVVLVAHGAYQAALEELRRPNTCLIGAVGYRPHRYGEYLADLVVRLLSGERVPQRNYIDLDLYTPDNVPPAVPPAE